CAFNRSDCRPGRAPPAREPGSTSPCLALISDAGAQFASDNAGVSRHRGATCAMVAPKRYDAPGKDRAAMAKTPSSHFFEDLRLGQVIAHATPRTVTAGFNVLYTALYGTRFAVQSSDAFARAIGYPRAPIDDLLVFHIVFGKTVPDISLNAVAN